MDKFAQYKKFFVALVGMVAMLLGLPMAGLEVATETLVEAFMGILTVLGVFFIKNKPNPEDPEVIEAGRRSDY